MGMCGGCPTGPSQADIDAFPRRVKVRIFLNVRYRRAWVAFLHCECGAPKPRRRHHSDYCPVYRSVVPW